MLTLKPNLHSCNIKTRKSKKKIESTEYNDDRPCISSYNNPKGINY